MESTRWLFRYLSRIWCNASEDSLPSLCLENEMWSRDGSFFLKEECNTYMAKRVVVWYFNIKDLIKWNRLSLVDFPGNRIRFYSWVQTANARVIFMVSMFSEIIFDSHKDSRKARLIACLFQFHNIQIIFYIGIFDLTFLLKGISLEDLTDIWQTTDPNANFKITAVRNIAFLVGLSIWTHACG